MTSGRPASARGFAYSAVASLDLVHLMLSCGVAIPPIAERSAVDYIAAYLGDGGCADLVRACLRDVTGSSERLRERLAPVIHAASASGAMAFPGPMPGEALQLAGIVSGRAAYLMGPEPGSEASRSD